MNRDSVRAFKTAAERYVALIDAAESMERIDLFLDLASALSGLHSAALELPHTRPGSTDLEAHTPGHKSRSAALKRMESLLGADDWYRTVEPPSMKETPGLLAGSLADDLTDVYSDLKDGLNRLGAGVPGHAVLWEWRFSFWGHWGEHAVRALRIIHARLAVEGLA